jgi:hypothetical protein
LPGISPADWPKAAARRERERKNILTRWQPSLLFPVLPSVFIDFPVFFQRADFPLLFMEPGLLSPAKFSFCPAKKRLTFAFPAL